jgi:hypothetical protein
MLAFFLFLLLVAMILGIVGFVAKGLFYLFIIGVVIFLISLFFAGTRLRRRGPTR